MVNAAPERGEDKCCEHPAKVSWQAQRNYQGQRASAQPEDFPISYEGGLEFGSRNIISGVTLRYVLPGQAFPSSCE